MSKKILIENEGALFRGSSVSRPEEVWNPATGWTAYKGEVPKPQEWGAEISQAEADALMRERAPGGEQRQAAE